MSRLKDITGQKFGHLEVIKYLGYNSKLKGAMWECQCDCGNKYITTGNHLRTGHTSHCGCQILKFGEKNPCYKHGKRNTRLYKIFAGMKQRCYNKNNPDYKNYGGRNIKICDEWLYDFMFFYNWAIENGYQENLTIDRIDVNEDYEPSNCRWITLQAQNWNTTRTKNIPPKEILREFKIL